MSEILREFRVATVFTSWRADHLLAGVSDLELFPLLRSANVPLFVCDRLHAKVVIDRTLSSAFFGSANLTANGLGLSQNPNIEVATLADGIEPEIRALVSNICASATVVTPEVYEIFKQWIEIHPKVPSQQPAAPDLSTCTNRGWLVDNLPRTGSPREFWQLNCLRDSNDEDLLHDLVLFPGFPKTDFVSSLSFLRQSLDRLPLFCSIRDEIARSASGVHFGGVKALIQSRCTDLKTPLRCELTDVAQSLIVWIADAYPDQFEIVRPRFSQVIRRRSPAPPLGRE